MEDLSLHILDIAENSLRAGASRLEIHIHEDPERAILEVLIRDNGRGMDAVTLTRVRDPFYTTRTTRKVGLGISLFEQAAQATGGHVTISSTPGKGTDIRATFHTDHIDMKPLGDLTTTIITLLMGYPDVDLYYRHSKDGGEDVLLDTNELKKDLDGIPLNTPEVMAEIKKSLAREEKNLSKGS
jgi:anti-sigma regulatory factor (Ser/Thr protein kinase)